MSFAQWYGQGNIGMMPSKMETLKPQIGERRRVERFQLYLPVQLTDGTGITRDISTSGIFFETKEHLSVGDRVTLSVDFSDSAPRCEGRVVRVEALDGKFGVAVRFEAYGFSN